MSHDAASADRAAKRPRHEEDGASAAPAASPARFVPCDAISCLVAAQLLPLVGRPGLELEVRLGHFRDTRGQRLVLPIETPAVVNCPHRAVMQVDAAHFQTFAASVRALGGATPLPHRRETTEDRCFADRRESYSPDGVLLGAVRKEKVLSVDIVLPGMAYDIRIGAAFEHPVSAATTTSDAPAPPAPVAAAGAKAGAPATPEGPQVTRTKERDVYTISPALRCDLTSVRQSQSRYGATSAPQYEFEIEAVAVPESRDELILLVHEMVGLATRLVATVKK